MTNGRRELLREMSDPEIIAKYGNTQQERAAIKCFVGAFQIANGREDGEEESKWKMSVAAAQWICENTELSKKTQTLIWDAVADTMPKNNDLYGRYKELFSAKSNPAAPIPIKKWYCEWVADGYDNAFAREENWVGDMVKGFVIYCIKRDRKERERP